MPKVIQKKNKKVWEEAKERHEAFPEIDASIPEKYKNKSVEKEKPRTYGSTARG